MGANPFLGLFLHWFGGLASASFYVPYGRVRGWSWETYWLVGGLVSWIVMPWMLAAVLTKDLLVVLRTAPPSAIFWAYIFGVLWGLGGPTFGLTMRYLGLSLGMAVALGYTATTSTGSGAPQIAISSIEIDVEVLGGKRSNSLLGLLIERLVCCVEKNARWIALMTFAVGHH